MVMPASNFARSSTRHLFVRQRTMLINALRAHLAECGIVAGVGRNGLERLLKVIEDGDDGRVPSNARDCLLALRDQLEMVKHQILDADRRILAWHKMSEVSQRLDDIPGVGPLIATALVASVPDPHAFKTGRDLAAWIGLVPRQNSTGGKERLGHISKAGNRYRYVGCWLKVLKSRSRQILCNYRSCRLSLTQYLIQYRAGL